MENLTSPSPSDISRFPADQQRLLHNPIYKMLPCNYRRLAREQLVYNLLAHYLHLHLQLLKPLIGLRHLHSDLLALMAQLIEFLGGFAEIVAVVYDLVVVGFGDEFIEVLVEVAALLTKTPELDADGPLLFSHPIQVTVKQS